MHLRNPVIRPLRLIGTRPASGQVMRTHLADWLALVRSPAPLSFRCRTGQDLSPVPDLLWMAAS